MVDKEKKELTKEEQLRKDRREFLGKSKYAAYMTPLMLSMVVDDAAAACSTNPQGTQVGNCP
ncbi:MAG: hypothetical protein KAT06_08815 [Gammaproteobacteria bacterium]|nr:hypothetical protein [Gammaproteobacteria bacterium]